MGLDEGGLMKLKLSNIQLTELYAEFCDVIERDNLSISDDYYHTSAHARKVASELIQRMMDTGYLRELE